VLRHLRTGLFSLGFLAIVSGALVLVTKNLIIFPVLNWIRSLTEDQLDLYVSVWGRLLIVIGILLFLLSSALFWLRRRSNSKGP
jgi:uncharacterized membrane protein (UPF0182 family)